MPNLRLEQHSEQEYPLASQAPPVRPTQEIGTRLPPDEHYIDFTGSSLYWNSQVEGAMRVRSAAHQCETLAPPGNWARGWVRHALTAAAAMHTFMPSVF